MRFPIATLLLAVLVAAPYFYFSQGTLYLPENVLETFSLYYGQSTGLFTHMFVHVGIKHLIGNLLPLIAFAFLIEQTALSTDVLAIFFSSGVLSGLLFSIINPSYFLIGASAGISGLMSAFTALKPKQALVLLIIVPLSLYLIFLPLVSDYSTQQQKILAQEKTVLEKQVSSLIQQNKTLEAGKKQAALNANRQKLLISEEGSVREQTTPTDFLVHAFGALIGVAYLFLFRRDLIQQGAREFAELGKTIFSTIEKIKSGQ